MLCPQSLLVFQKLLQSPLLKLLGKVFWAFSMVHLVRQVKAPKEEASIGEKNFGGSYFALGSCLFCLVCVPLTLCKLDSEAKQNWDTAVASQLLTSKQKQMGQGSQGGTNEWPRAE